MSQTGRSPALSLLSAFSSGGHTMTNFEKFPHKTNSNNSGATLTSWSRQQKIAMIAGFVILGILIALSACSKDTPKTALVGISRPDAASAVLGVSFEQALSAIRIPRMTNPAIIAIF